MRPHSAALPRPEYPRPDRQRGLIEGVDWLNLNGPWQFRFSPRCGPPEPECVDPASEPWDEHIIVPFCWESLAAWGEADTAGNDHYHSRRAFVDAGPAGVESIRTARRHEVGWYRRLVQIPDAAPWRGKRVILTVGAADFATDCWCNGRHLGRHEGGYVPFEFDLTDALAASPTGAKTAFIVFRVEDPMDNREQPVGKQWAWYTTTSGIWQTVFIEPRSAAHIDSFRIVPDIDQARVGFTVLCAGPVEGHRVTVEILPPQAPAGEQSLPDWDAAALTAHGSQAISPLRLWDPDHPFLYQLILRLRDPQGTMVDEIRSYFGMRKIGTAPAESIDGPAALSLNNQPIYLRGALYQSYHPDGIYTAGDVSTIRNDIAFARKAGFDFLRIHIKLDDPLVLYYADRLGMLIMQDFPNFGEGGDTPLGRRRFEEMLRQGIARDFNHPSIISWCIFNESWGFGGQNELVKLFGPPDPRAVPDVPADQVPERMPDKIVQKLANSAAFAWIHRTWLLAKQLDPTRLIEDMSVVAWEHLAAYGHVDTDINSWHFYIDDYERAKTHISNVVANTHRGSPFNYIEGYAQGNAPLINSEYGGVGALDGDRDISWSFRFLTNELRLHGQLSAYIFTELTDVEWERNGFLNYDRTVKSFGYDPVSVNHGDVLPIDAPPIRLVQPGERLSIEVSSSHFSRERRDGVILTWRYSGIDDLGVAHPLLASGHVPIAFPHHRVALASAIELQAPEQGMLCTLDVSASDRNGTLLAKNHIQHLVSAGPLPERSERGRTIIHRPRLHGWESAHWPAGMSSTDDVQRDGFAWGRGTGFFQWTIEDERLRRPGPEPVLRVIIELSSHKEGTPQTDHERLPSRCLISLNGIAIQQIDLPDHPHDARGALSYLRGGRGSYGYLVVSVPSGTILQQVLASARAEGRLHLRCTVEAALPGGLTIYGDHAGRYPVGPTVLISDPATPHPPS